MARGGATTCITVVAIMTIRLLAEPVMFQFQLQARPEADSDHDEQLPSRVPSSVRA